MSHLLSDALQLDGHRVTSLRDGFELVAFLAAQGVADRVDLVISDVRMPRKSGLEALAEIRHAPWRAPVLLITGFGDGLTETYAARLGAVGTLSKPFELDELRALVRTLVERGRTEPTRPIR